MTLFNNDFFKDMTLEQIQEWINTNKDILVGSAIFTRNASVTSKVVQWAEKWRCKDCKFTPSHTGSIVSFEDDIYIFDMKPLRASKQPLDLYLFNTKDEFIIVLRNFKLDDKMFSKNILEHEGEFYPFMSAVRSVFTKRESKWRRHCSELHLRELQKQEVYISVNPEITPDELLHIMQINL